MKKFLSILLSMVVILPMYSLQANAAIDNENSFEEKSNKNYVSINDEDVSYSDVMTFSEMVEHYAKSAGITYEEALNAFPASEYSSYATPSYRTLSVGLNVSSEFKPRLEFYCQTSEYGTYWGIQKVYSMQLVRSYNGISKQFSGNVEMWLRSAYQIEFVVNGDFYNNGTTTVTGGNNMQLGIGEYAQMSCSASISTTTNHYKYFYDHRTINFQQ